MSEAPNDPAFETPAAEVPVKTPKTIGARPKTDSTKADIPFRARPAPPVETTKFAFRFWRCMNCDDHKGDAGFDFSLPSDQPGICPNCGIRATDPQLGMMIVPLVVTHWEPPHPDLKGGGRGIGSGVLACNPKLRAGGEHRVSAEVKVVNCPACLVAAAEAGYQATGGFDPRHDFLIEAPTKEG